jgi:hypothetical protein
MIVKTLSDWNFIYLHFRILSIYILEFYELRPVLLCNSEGVHLLPDDGTWRPKHVGAIDGWKINNISKIGEFVGLSYIYDRMHGARIKNSERDVYVIELWPLVYISFFNHIFTNYVLIFC